MPKLQELLDDAIAGQSIYGNPQASRGPGPATGRGTKDGGYPVPEAKGEDGPASARDIAKVAGLLQKLAKRKPTKKNWKNAEEALDAAGRAFIDAGFEKRGDELLGQAHDCWAAGKALKESSSVVVYRGLRGVTAAQISKIVGKDIGAQESGSAMVDRVDRGGYWSGNASVAKVYATSLAVDEKPGPLSAVLRGKTSASTVGQIQAVNPAKGREPVEIDRVWWFPKSADAKAVKLQEGSSMVTLAKGRSQDLGFGFNEDGFPLQGRREYQGLPIPVENLAGTDRVWYDPDGNETGRTKMYCHYGYVEGATGADGEDVDVYLGPDEGALFAYVVHQNKKPDFAEYDEDKVMLGFPSEEAAKQAYMRQYDDPRFYGGMSSMPMEKFKEKLAATGGKKITNEARRRSARGIAHLDDLSPADFVAFLAAHSSGGLEASEKVDGGAYVEFGQEGGRLWTKSKNGPRRSSAAEYSAKPAHEAIRSAHEALAGDPRTAQALIPGLSFEADVLQSARPNVVEYGDKAVVIHGAREHGKRLDAASSRAAAREFSSSLGGKTTTGWVVVYRPDIPHGKLDVDFKAELETARELLATGDRAGIEGLKRSVKGKLLDKARGMGSAFGKPGGDAEGIVFRDSSTGTLTKLVDKELFGRLGRFFWKYRELLDKGHGPAGSFQKGVLARFRDRVADDVFGGPGLKSPAFVAQLAKSGAATADEALASWIDSKASIQPGFLGKFSAAVAAALEEVRELREEWENQRASATVDLPGRGPEKIPDEPAARTDAAFEQAEKDLSELASAATVVKNAGNQKAQALALLKVVMGQEKLDKLAAALPQKSVTEAETAKMPAVQSSPSTSSSGEKDKGIGVDQAWSVLERNMDRLEKKGIRVDALKEIAAGSRGVAFDMTGGKVLKVTNDSREAVAANKLKGMHLKHVVKFYDVFQFKEGGGHPEGLFGIVQDKLKPIPGLGADPSNANSSSGEARELNLAVSIFEIWKKLRASGYEWGKTRDLIAKQANDDVRRLRDKKLTKLALKRAHEYNAMYLTLKKFHIPQMVEELAGAGIKFHDYHAGNIMLKPDGQPALIDIGISEVQGGQKPPVLEKMVEAALDELGAKPPPVPHDVRKDPGGGISEPVAQGFLKTYAKLLAKKGINAASAKKLAQGSRGVAFDVGGNKVLKITNDFTEAVAANKIKSLNLKHVVKFYEVFRFPAELQKLGHVYGVLQEKLIPLAGAEDGNVSGGKHGIFMDGEAGEINQALTTLQFSAAAAEGDFKWPKTREAIFRLTNAMMDRSARGRVEKKLEIGKAINDAYKLIRKVGIKEMMEELSGAGITFGDYHAGNIMKRPGGGYALVDIGVSKVAGGKEPPVLEAKDDPTTADKVAALRDKQKASKSTMVQDINRLVYKNADKLARKGIHAKRALGAGSHGVAFDTSEGRVLKVTDDASEAKTSNYIKGKTLKHVVHIYDVFAFPGGKHYGILQEKLQPLAGIAEEAYEAFIDFLKAAKVNVEYLYNADFARFFEAIDKKYKKKPDVVRFVKGAAAKFKFVEMVEELSSLGIKFQDYHAKNVMTRAGEYVVTDLGVSESPGGLPPVLERRRAVGHQVVKEEVGGEEERAITKAISRYARQLQARGAYVVTDVGFNRDGGKAPPTLGEMVIEALEVAPELSEAPRPDRVGVTIGRFQPPHRGHAEVIRNLAKGRTKVLVYVAGLKKDERNPFSYETRVKLLQMQLPDVWTKVEVHKAEAGGKQSGYIPALLSATAQSGESTLKGDTAVEVSVGPDRVEEVKQQFARAVASGQGGAHDPALAVVSGVPGYKESEDAAGRVSATQVRKALSQGDKDAFKRLVDPHLVSDEAKLEDAWVSLRKELGLKEGFALREGAPDGFLTPEDILSLLKLARGKLSRRGYEVGKSLGHGDNGVAFELKGGRVLKITGDEDEARASFAVKGKSLAHVVRVYDVFKFPLRDADEYPAWGIVEERLEKLSSAEKQEFGKVEHYFRESVVMHQLQAGKGWEDVVRTVEGRIQRVASSAEDLAARKKEFMALAKRFQLPEMVGDLLSAGVRFADYHRDNVMKRGAEYVVIDLGLSRSDGGDPPILEKLTDLPGGEITIAKVLAANKGALAKRPIPIPWPMKSIASGQDGIAFDTGKGYVLKVTTNRSEAQASMAVKGKPLRHIVMIVDVFKFKDGNHPQAPEGIYGIMQEKLQPLTEKEKQHLDFISPLLQDWGFQEALLAGGGTAMVDRARKLIQDLVDKTKYVGDRLESLVDQAIRLVGQYKFPEILKELRKHHVHFKDFHSENVMKRGDEYVVIDLGRSRSPERGHPPLAEKSLAEAGTAPGVTGPGQSQQGARAGSSAWSSPRPYTEDDVEAAKAGEFEMWSDVLKGVND